MTASAAATPTLSKTQARVVADGNADATSLLYGRLAQHAAGHGNDHALACMIASLCNGAGALPDWLGLEPPAFACLLGHHFPELDLGDQPQAGRPLAARNVKDMKWKKFLYKQLCEAEGI